jgi:Protein of unknown function (DUF2934)
MPHFCGRTHSTRDRHIPLAGDAPRPRTVLTPGTAALTPAAPARAAAIAVPRPAGPAPKAPTHQQIAALAYSYWEARGRQGGSPEADWLRAEKELAARSL